MFKIRYVSFIVSYYDFDRIVNIHRVACACHGLVLSIEGLCRKTYYKFIWNKNVFGIDKKTILHFLPSPSCRLH